jgi:hypothetical protein
MPTFRVSFFLFWSTSAFVPFVPSNWRNDSPPILFSSVSAFAVPDREKPNRLYHSCEWDAKHIRRMVSNGQLAARLLGSDSRLSKADRECPICFMYYSETNVSKCCNATVCTECYLQIKPQKDKHTTCPFCNNPKLIVTVQGGMDEGDVAKREEEEQRVIEATIKSRVMELHGECPVPAPGGAPSPTPSPSFGSSLENYNRSRALSNASSSSIGDPSPSGTPTHGGAASSHGDASSAHAIQLLAMSPDDRRALESEMRAQLSHETHRRMEVEAEEARRRHTREWYGGVADARLRAREARLAELTGLLERMGSARGGGGLGPGGGDGDDTLMARDGGERGGGRGGGAGGAASLSRLIRAMENSSSLGGGRSSSLEELMRLEAAFFLGMDDESPRPNYLAAGGQSYVGNSISDDNNNMEAMGAGLFGLGGRPPSSIRAPNRIVRNRFGSNRLAGTSAHMDTVELLMRGVSEEEQLAMAIAMSMHDAQQQQQLQSVGVDRQEATAESSAAQDVYQSNNSRTSEGGADEDSSSSESSLSDSSVEDLDYERTTNDRAVSLDEDEEEVVFSNRSGA